ncbi:MAG TPA: hypothetical protein VFB28_14055 [Terriglobales bacterium]|nr:hypothetical protein [Terriglobales bacterium]
MSEPQTSANQARLELELVRGLSREISTAIAAVEHNDLPALQASIAQQERMCRELASRPWSLPTSGAQKSDALHEAYAALAQLNRVYAGLIRRSKRCIDLLTIVYGASEANYEKQAAAAERQSLICEA